MKGGDPSLFFGSDFGGPGLTWPGWFSRPPSLIKVSSIGQGVCRICCILAVIFLCLPCLGQARILDPFAIYGYVSDREGNHVGSGVSVTVINEGTGEWLTTYTNEQGQYIVDLSMLSSGYGEGDLLRINANDGRFMGTGSVSVNLSQPGIRVDLALVSPVGMAKGWDEVHLYSALGLFFLLVGFLVFLAVRRWRKGGPSREELMEVLSEDERRVVEILRDRGDMTQAEIRDIGDFSDATMSRIVKGLNSRGIVSKHRMGRTNMIGLNERYR